MLIWFTKQLIRVNNKLLSPIKFLKVYVFFSYDDLAHCCPRQPLPMSRTIVFKKTPIRDTVVGVTRGTNWLLLSLGENRFCSILGQASLCLSDKENKERDNFFFFSIQNIYCNGTYM